MERKMLQNRVLQQAPNTDQDEQHISKFTLESENH